MNTSHAATAAVKWAITLNGTKAAEYAAIDALNASAWEVGDTFFGGGSPASYVDNYQFASVIDAFRMRERWEQARLLRCMIGNPFRPVAFDPAWRTADAVTMATGIYDDRAFDRMPILADALLDAGCDDADILSHCGEAEGVHVRGCWVVDWLLGKE